MIKTGEISGDRWFPFRNSSGVLVAHQILPIRILVVATNKWPSIGLLVAALIKVGFETAVVCPSGSPINNIRNLNARYVYRPRQSLLSIRAAIADWNPSLLICNDDVAVHELQAIYSQVRELETGSPESTGLVELIELSLGDPRSFAVSRSKSRLMSAAKALGIRCPSTIVVDSHEDVVRHLGRISYPVLIKLDQSWGGRGVRLAHNQRELLRAVSELSFPHNWPKRLKQLAARAVQHLPDRWRIPLPQNISIQHYVIGRPANRAVVCWQGRILAGISVEAVETDSEFGPTTLARILDHDELAQATERIVESQNLSGFLGFDFLLDHANRAWFLEMNPRATPTCHLRFKAPSLAASLFSALTGEQPRDDVREVPLPMIAIFPNRVSQNSHHSYFDDTPAEEPEFRNASKRSRFYGLRKEQRTLHDLPATTNID
jgi:carbamoyl-phosphate synthase L subunit-like protein